MAADRCVLLLLKRAGRLPDRGGCEDNDQAGADRADSEALAKRDERLLFATLTQD